MDSEIFAGDLLWKERARCGDELVSTFLSSLKEANGTLFAYHPLTF